MDGKGSQVTESGREGSLKGRALTRRVRWQVEGLRSCWQGAGRRRKGWNGHRRGGSPSASRCDGSGASSSVRKPAWTMVGADVECG